MIKKDNQFLSFQAFFIACFVTVLAFLWQGNKGFNLADEGYLWYGAQQVMLGNVPLRDFMAYDPGRYYWSATMMDLLGNNSIMALRKSVAIFQALGLFVGLYLLAKTLKTINKQNIIYLILSSLILVTWMFPRHKLFDITICIFLIGMLAYLIENPTKLRYFFAGVVVSLAAFFGRNHGLYGITSGFFVILWLNITQKAGLIDFVNAFVAWGIGIIVGLTPLVLMMLLIPGFADAFWEGILFLFELKATNIPLPIPWPWNVDFSTANWEMAIRSVLIGLYFIAIVTFGIVSIVYISIKKALNNSVSAVLIATSFLAIPYAHYAYSRADVGHLALGIFPFLIGILAVLSTQPNKIKWPFASILSLTSLWVMYVFHPGWYCHSSKQCVDIQISKDKLKVDLDTAAELSLLSNLANKYAPNGKSFIVAPFWPGAYPLFNRKSPIWEIYALVPRSEAFQKVEIDRIKATEPGFILILTKALDGRDELSYKNTHPLVYNYILSHFNKIELEESNQYEIYRPINNTVAVIDNL